MDLEHKWKSVLFKASETMATVLVRKYGEINNRVNRGKKVGSNWWRDINIENGIWEFKLQWFSEKLCWKIGNGARTQFWSNPWLEGQILKNIFPYMFGLALHKEASSKGMQKGKLEHHVGTKS